MKVAFLSFDFGEYSIRLASALAGSCSVLLLMPEQTAQPYLDHLDSRVDFRPFKKPRLRQPIGQFRHIRWLFQQLQSFGADVLHLQQGALWLNLHLQLDYRFPVIYTVHDAEPHIGDKLSRKTPYFFWKLGFHRADQIIVHNNYVKDMLRSRLALPLQSLHVIPHLQVGGGAAPAAAAFDDGKTILFFGRIWPYKGLEYLIRAEPLISQQIPDVRIVIAGTGEDLDRYRRMMVHPERFVILNRHISEAEATQLFQSASVVVLPYIESSQSGVIPVAYTHRKPVIATTVGGLPEMVVHQHTGLLIPPRDERKLADAVLRVLANPKWREAMGRAGEQMIERECAPAAVARQTLNVYRIACLNRRSPVLRSLRPRPRLLD